MWVLGGFNRTQGVVGRETASTRDTLRKAQVQHTHAGPNGWVGGCVYDLPVWLRPSAHWVLFVLGALSLCVCVLCVCRTVS